MRVEELALESVLQLAAIGRVADEGMADGREVGANLVRAPGLQTGLEVGLGSKQLEHREMRSRLARSGARDRHAVTVPRGATDRRVDRAGARIEPPLGERQVDPLDLATLD